MINKLVNAQDQCIIALLREGVKGQEGSEITKLKKNDVDFEKGILTLTDKDYTQRKLKVSDKCLAIIERAIRENEYLKKNGNPDEDIRSEKAELIQNEFVIRSANTRTINLLEASPYIIYRRLKTLAKELNEPSITPQSIWHSGMIECAWNSMQEKGEIDYEQIKERFNLTDTVIQRLKLDFLNKKFVSEFYNPN